MTTPPDDLPWHELAHLDMDNAAARRLEAALFHDSRRDTRALLHGAIVATLVILISTWTLLVAFATLA